MLKPCLMLIGTLLSMNVFAETAITQSTLANVAIYPEVSIPASAISLNDAKISSEIRARVKSIPVLVGDKVKKGEILVELNTKDAKLNLRRSKVALKGIESRLELAAYQFEQAKALFKDKAITDELLRKRQADLTTLQAEKESQKVNVEIAQQELDKCIVRAPFNAVVTERLAQEGELANPGTQLIRVIDISHIEVSAKIQPQDIYSFENAGQLEFNTTNSVFTLKLRKLTETIDPIQRNREARLVFTEKIALPGSTGTLRWKQSTPHIPANLIVRRDNKLGVFINQNGKAKFIEIKNTTEGRPGPVDLALDSKIIVNGRFSTQNGDNLTIK